MSNLPISLLILENPKSSEKNLVEKLSPREREVCHWLYEGKRDREIGVILGISHRTVTGHVCSILKKLEVENRTCAALVWTRSISKENPFPPSALLRPLHRTPGDSSVAAF